MRRRQNKPPLTGKPASENRAWWKGWRCVSPDGDAELLQNVQLWLLDNGMLQAGAGMKGGMRRASSAD